jgi:predicted trehalose synthase
VPFGRHLLAVVAFRDIPTEEVRYGLDRRPTSRQRGERFAEKQATVLVARVHGQHDPASVATVGLETASAV